MPSKPPAHVVERLRFAIDIHNADSLAFYSSRIRNLLEGELGAALETALDQVAGPAVILRIPKLEINLGEVRSTAFDQDIRAAFAQALTRALEDVLSPEQRKAISRLRPEDESLEALQYFIQTGLLPWWHARNRSSMDSLYRKLIQSQPKPTRALSIALGGVFMYRQRILAQFTDDTLNRLFALLGPAPASFFKQYIQEFERIHRQERVVNEEDQKFKKVLQELIFIFLLDHKATSLDQADFLKSNLHRLGQRYGISYRRLLLRIRESIDDIPALRKRSSSVLHTLTNILFEEEFALTKPGQYRNQESRARIELEDLRFFIEKGYFPGGDSGYRFITRDILFEQLAMRAPVALEAVIRETGHAASVRRRLVGGFGSDAVRALFGLLAPFSTDSLYSVFELFEQIEERTKPFNQEKIAFRLVLRELALTILLERPKGQIGLAYFIQRQLEELSKKYAIAHEKLVALLRSELRAQKKSSNFFLFNVLDQLFGDAQPFANEPFASKEPDATSEGDLDIRTAQWMREGSLEQMSKAALDRVWNLLLPRQSVLTQRLLRLFMQSKPAGVGISDTAIKRFLLERFLRDSVSEMSETTLLNSLFLKFGRPDMQVAWLDRMTQRLAASEEPARTVLEGLRSKDFVQKASIQRLGFGITLEMLVDYLGKAAVYRLIGAEASEPLEAVWSRVVAEESAGLLELLEASRLRSRVLDYFVEQLTPEALEQLLAARHPQAFAAFEQVKKALVLFQQQYAFARLTPEAFNAYLLRQVLPFFLDRQKTFIDPETYLLYVLEAMVGDGILTRKALLRLLQKQAFEGSFQWIARAVRLFINPEGARKLDTRTVNRQFYANLVLYYLKSGHFPYWASENVFASGALEGCFRAALERQDFRFIEDVLALPDAPQVFQRLLTLTTDADRSLLIGLLQRYTESFGPFNFFREGKQWLSELLPNWPSHRIEAFLLRHFFDLRIWTLRSAEYRMQRLVEVLIGETGEAQLMRFLEQRYPAFWSLLRQDVEKAYLNGLDPMQLFRYFMEEGMDQPLQATGSIDTLRARWVRLVEQDPDLFLSVFSGFSFHPTRTRLISTIFSIDALVLLFRAAARKRQLESPFLLDFLEALLRWALRFLGRYDYERMLDQLAALLLFSSTASYKQFGEVLQQLARQSPTTKAYLIRFFKVRHIPPESPQIWMYREEAATEAQTELPEPEDPEKWEYLKYYLQFGSLPPAASDVTLEHLVGAFDAQVERAPMQVKRHVHAWANIQDIRRRFIHLLGEQRLNQVMDIIHPALQDTLNTFGEILKQKEYPPFWEGMACTDNLSRMDTLLQTWSKGSFLQPFATTVLHPLAVRYAEKIGIAPAAFFQLLQEATSSKIPTVPTLVRELTHIQEEIQEARQQQVASQQVEEVVVPGEAIHIYNAGMVLLWPFLGRFFRRLNMVEGSDFKDEEARRRAILLLEYLVTGKTSFEEHQLALNKLLCGAPMDYTVDRVLDLTEEEVQLAESLIKGAVYNWEKLRGTRVKTFQETFLQREGRLVLLENRWELTVERKAYDLLLDTLPWSIAMIKIGWMKDRLVVLWT